MEIAVFGAMKTVCRTALALKSMANTRAKEKVIEGLESHQITLAQAKTDDPNYVGCLLRTIDAIERASCEEKVSTLLALFTTCNENGFIESSPDDYQEVLMLIDDLSFREMHILYQLDTNGVPYVDVFEDKEAKQSECYIQYSTALEKVSKNLGFDVPTLKARMARLTRSGLLVSTPVFDGAVYYFSPLYKELKSIISHKFHQS